MKRETLVLLFYWRWVWRIHIAIIINHYSDEARIITSTYSACRRSWFDSPIGWDSCRLLQHFPMLDLSFLVYLCASSTHPLSWTRSRGKPPSPRWNSARTASANRAGDDRGSYIATNSQSPLVRPPIAGLSDARRSCNIRQTRSVMIPTVDYYRDNGRRVQRHDQGLYESQSFDKREVGARDCGVIARAAIVGDRIIAIIITFIVSPCPPIVRPTIEPRFSERNKYLSRKIVRRTITLELSVQQLPPSIPAKTLKWPWFFFPVYMQINQFNALTTYNQAVISGRSNISENCGAMRQQKGPDERRKNRSLDFTRRHTHRRGKISIQKGETNNYGTEPVPSRLPA